MNVLSSSGLASTVANAAIGKRAFAILLLATLSGCGVFSRNLGGQFWDRSYAVDLHSPYPVVNRHEIELLQLSKHLDPDDLAERRYADQGSSKGPWQSLDDSAKLQYAFAAFYTYDGGDVERLQFRRNQIQERVLAASVQRCNVFKVYLQRSQSNSDFWLGTASTVTGVLGALVNGVQAARNLAGSAGIFSGVRAEYNQAYFSNLTASVVAEGIARLQDEAYERIQLEGQAKPINIYNVEAALKDAIYFDGLCSVVAGLRKASDSIQKLADPGLDTANRVLLKARATRSILNNEITDIAELQKSGYGTYEAAHGLVGSRLGKSSLGLPQVDGYVPLLEQMGGDQRAIDISIERMATRLISNKGIEDSKVFQNQRKILIDEANVKLKSILDEVRGCDKSARVKDLVTRIAAKQAELGLLKPDNIVGRESLVLERSDLTVKVAAYARRSSSIRQIIDEYLARQEKALAAKYKEAGDAAPSPSALGQYFAAALSDSEVGNAPKCNSFVVT